MKKLAAAMIVAASLHPASHAQDAPALPDPATIVVPDLSESGKPEVIGEGSKYFFFHREGVSFETAHADLSDCFRFLQPWQNTRIDQFVPWDSAPSAKMVPLTNAYGLVRAILLEGVEGVLHHRDYQAKLRMCMEPRGYTRYGVAKGIWKRVTDLPQDLSIAVQAKIASGPAFGKQVRDR